MPGRRVHRVATGNQYSQSRLWIGANFVGVSMSKLVPLEFSTTTAYLSKLVYVVSGCRVLTASPPMGLPLAPWLRLRPAEMALAFTGSNNLCAREPHTRKRAKSQHHRQPSRELISGEHRCGLTLVIQCFCVHQVRPSGLSIRS